MRKISERRPQFGIAVDSDVSLDAQIGEHAFVEED